MQQVKGQLKLWYEQPSEEWTDALPVGNGRLGGMVFGGLDMERIQLNEDTFWAGYPTSEYNEEAQKHLHRARSLIKQKRYTEANQLVTDKMLGTDGLGIQPYQPLGNLYIRLNHESDSRSYMRALDLEHATVHTAYDYAGHRYKRTVFASAVDQVLVVRLDCDSPDGISCTISLESLLNSIGRTRSDNELIMEGTAPLYVRNHNNRLKPSVCLDDPDQRATRFATGLRIVQEGGSLQQQSDTIEVNGAQHVYILLAAATSYAGPKQIPGQTDINPIQEVEKTIEQAAFKTYEQLWANHVHDYQQLFQRVKLDIVDSSDEKKNQLPTDTRIRKVMHGQEDPQLIALLFQYGRYLLISSSRPGTQAANLQGIWNDHIQPPWNCDYHLNINTPMNYWPAEVCNLSECHEPLFTLIEELAEKGRETARIQYGCRGWVAHTMTDIWRNSNVGPSGNPTWAFWTMGGAWLCQHLWEHYQFNLDESFLKQRAWPIIREAAKFMLDWLVEDDDGYLTTSPSVSPEHEFYSPEGQQPCAVTAGVAMDLSIARQLLGIAAKTAEIVGVDGSFGKECAQAAAQIRPLRIGKEGQIQEWDEDFDDTEPHHRHLSQLFAFHPGDEITVERDPELYQAVRRTMERRGDEGTGWSMGWKVGIWARLQDGNHAYRIIRNFLHLVTDEGADYHKGGIYPNLFCAHPPFQIDGNFGVTASIAEMLVQSHRGHIHLLPALPDVMLSGSVTGLRARGGYTVDMTWQNGQLASVTLYASRGGDVSLCYKERTTTVSCNANEAITLHVQDGALLLD